MYGGYFGPVFVAQTDSFESPGMCIFGGEKPLPIGTLPANSAPALDRTMPDQTSPPKKVSLKLLGSASPGFPDEPNCATLETFTNAYPQRDYWIRFESADFTSLCPVTGQADFARITIDYVPGELCIETKSLKFYLSSFRNTRSFNEEIANRILEDLVAACGPRQIFVLGEFAARGGISVSVEAFHPATAQRRLPHRA